MMTGGEAGNLNQVSVFVRNHIVTTIRTHPSAYKISARQAENFCVPAKFRRENSSRRPTGPIGPPPTIRRPSGLHKSRIRLIDRCREINFFRDFHQNTASPLANRPVVNIFSVKITGVGCYKSKILEVARNIKKVFSDGEQSQFQKNALIQNSLLIPELSKPQIRTTTINFLGLLQGVQSRSRAKIGAVSIRKSNPKYATVPITGLLGIQIYDPRPLVGVSRPFLSSACKVRRELRSIAKI